MNAHRVLQLGHKVLLMAQRRGVWGFVRFARQYMQPYECCLYSRDLLAGDYRASAPPEGVSLLAGNLQRLRTWRASQGQVSFPFLRDSTDGWRFFWWALVGGDVAGIAWAATESPLLKMAPSEFAIFSVLTLPEYRGRGIARGLVVELCKEMRERRFERAYAIIEVHNVASRKAFEHAGFHLVATTIRRWSWSGKPLFCAPACLEQELCKASRN